MATDYIKRMIEQFGIFWRQILQLRAGGKIDQARQTLNQAAERFFNLNTTFLDLLPDDQLLALCQIGDGLDAEKVLVLANILKLDADLLDADEADTLRRYERALLLYSLAAQARAPEGAAYREEIDNLLFRLQHYTLSTASLERILTIYDQRVAYASAEDYLFGLIDLHGASSELLACAERWYEQLLTRSDAQLSAGNLPREEVIEGLDKLRTMRPTTS